MEKNKLKSVIEAVLFASGDAISFEKLEEITECNADELQIALSELIDEYNYQKRGIKIIKLGAKYQMATRGEYAEFVQRIVEPKKRNPLSKASLEVLAIIAYKQPVTRSGIEYVRGVNSDNSVSRLLELGLIEEVGRKDSPGRPALFGTTDEFLRNFALSGLDELIPLEDFIIEEIDTEGGNTAETEDKQE